MTTTTTPESKRRRRPYSQRERAGMAILMVVTAIAICMVIVNEFGTRTTVDTLQARNNLDQMRAHFLARSSLDVTDLVMRLQARLDKAGADHPELGLDGVQITDYADMLMGAFGGTPEEVESAVGLSLDEAKGLGSDIGGFGVHITPIDGKINLNCAATGGVAGAKMLRRALEALFFPPAFDSVFEEPDAEGWRRDRKTQIDAIMDYIDPNLDRVDTPGAPEDYGYEGLKDKYKAKNHPIDSVDELKLVRGVDDRFFTLFGGAFRVSGECRVNLRALDDPNIIAALIWATSDDKDPAARDPINLYAIANLVIQAKQFGFYFTTADEFIEFVKDPEAAFATLANPAGGGGGSGAATPPLPSQLTSGVKVQGVVLKKQDLQTVAMSGPVRLYDIEVYGEVTRGGILNPLRRTIHATWDQKYQLESSRVATKLSNKQGAWLYLREE